MIYWALFAALGVIWGSSFLLIKIGIHELDTLSLVSVRLGIAGLAFALSLLLMRKPIPRDRKTLVSLVVVGIANTAAPFLLITWAENQIDSGLASVLNATVPLFSIVLAHVALPDDKIHTGKVLGLITGFLGVVLLALRNSPAQVSPLGGMIAMLGATVCYAFSAVYIRRTLRHVDSGVTAGVSIIIGAVAVIAFTLLTQHPLPVLAALSTQTVLAMLVLGLFNTFIAYTIFFYLVRNWGASRTTLVTYVLPPIGLVLGVLFAQERIDLQLIIGAALIIGGVALANLRKPPAAQPVERPESPARQTAA
ncbi:MAG: EamA family transporter [Anaerolineae bacterium]|nr:EamA family transporter [Anaerolineae bacterium]